jgi:hypothetical protein
MRVNTLPDHITAQHVLPGSASDRWSELCSDSSARAAVVSTLLTS